MSHTRKMLLLLAGILVIAAIAIVMGSVTGRWIPAVGLLFGVVPIGIYGFVILAGSERAAQQLGDDER